jgi:hypothetical protein
MEWIVGAIHINGGCPGVVPRKKKSAPFSKYKDTSCCIIVAVAIAASGKGARQAEAKVKNRR